MLAKLKGTRYETARAFAAGEAGGEPFPGVRPRPIGAAEGVIEHTVRAGDRMDLLARHYYNDDRLWWRILDANPELLYGGDAVREREEPGALEGEIRPSMVGRVIVIPRARE